MCSVPLASGSSDIIIKDDDLEDDDDDLEEEFQGEKQVLILCFLIEGPHHRVQILQRLGPNKAEKCVEVR